MKNRLSKQVLKITNKQRFLPFLVLVCSAVFSLSAIFMFAPKKYEFKSTKPVENAQKQEEVNPTSESSDEVVEVQPTITTNRLTSPPIRKGEKQYIMTIPILSYWKIKDHNFTSVNGNVYFYRITLENIDGRYSVTISDTEGTEPGVCVFPEDNQGLLDGPYTVGCKLEREINTSYGKARIVLISRMASDDEYKTFFLAQADRNDNLWYLSPRLGRVSMRVPVDYDQQLFEEIVTVVQLIKLNESNSKL